MQKRKGVASVIKRALAGMLAVAAVGTGISFAQPIVTEAAGSSILSAEDRGVIYANSRTDFRDESIYFLITTRFYDGDPSNNSRSSDDETAQNPPDDPSWRGDFKGLIDKLDYIKALGFTAVWITPVVQNKSGYDYHGYHAYNFSAVDTRYESNGITYQDLIDACHAKGMKIIQDVVINHTSNWGEENLLQINDPVYAGGRSEYMMPSGASKDPENIYHHNGYCGGADYDNYEAQNRAMHSDCFDLETENPRVYNYLVDCYTNYINMGVDAFRVDTVKHISRLTLNSVFVPAFKEAGGDNFYMFGEVCTKGHDVWYREHPPLSCAFYTWAEDGQWANCWTDDLATNESLVEQHYKDHCDTNNQPTSDNAFLNGNEYHTPDYSERSGMDVIDFQMHWSFVNANNAFNMALKEDKYFNDSTWNVVYVDSHDYGPDEFQTKRYPAGTDAWAENLSLMFTFRGIPCIFYGTEIEFQADKPIDVGPESPLSETGRAYYGDNIEGTVTATGFTDFGNVSGQVADTLSQPLSQHIMRLNRLRQSIPALRKGQYSTEDCSGNMAFKRRYTDSSTDSFALVAISGNATFNNIPNGTYVDAVTGDTQTVSNGTLTANVSGKGNMKVYVLNTSKTPAPGRVIPNGKYLTDGGAIEDITGGSVDVVEPTGISLSSTSVTVKEGTSEKVTATVTPSNATNKTVTWTTSNTNVATVAGGTITGVAPGTATITAKTSNGLTATVKVTVTENTDIVKPTGITVSPNSLTLTEGDTGSLNATVTPSNATNKTVTWTSGDASVATVDSSGNIKAVGEGTTTITAATFNGYKATATVTVEPKEITIVDGAVYFEKPAGWGSNINVYFFRDNQTVGNSWPGTAMTDMGDGVYTYKFEGDDSNLMVIFNDGGNQTADLQYVRNGYYNSSGYVRTVEPVQNGTVNVKYVDEDGKVLGTDKKTGSVGSSYTTTAKSFDGYTLKTRPSNASGTFTASTITVTYIYKKNSTPVTELVNNSTISATSITYSDTITFTGKASGGTSPYKYRFAAKHSTDSKYTILKDYDNSAATKVWRPTKTGTYTVLIRVQDSTGEVASKTYTLTVKSATSKLVNNSTISATSISYGNTITFTGKASGGTSPYQYRFAAKHSSDASYTILKDYNSSATTKVWRPRKTGAYTVLIRAKDKNGTVASKTYTLTVKQAATLTNKSTISATSITYGDTITFTGKASGGTSPYQYRFAAKHSSSSGYTILKDYDNSAATKVWRPTKSGTYTVLIRSKDKSGTVASKTYTLSVVAPLANKSTISATSVTYGNTVTFTGKASGGSGSYQYRFAAKHSSASSYTILKDYSNSATTKVWRPTKTGTYTVLIRAKDKAGTVASKTYTLTVKSAALTNSSTISATSISYGKTITFTGKASGGTSPYQYRFAAKHSSASSYTILKDYDNSATTKVWRPTKTGTYSVLIRVKDKNGTVASKTYTLTVK